MGTLTIESAVKPDFDPLMITYTSNVESDDTDRDTNLTDGIGIGSNVISRSYEAALDSEPLVWNPVGFNPDEVTINSVGYTGIGGANLYELDGVTLLSLPETYTISGTPSDAYKARLISWDTDFSGSVITINITATDTVAGISVTKDVTLTFNYEAV